MKLPKSTIFCSFKISARFLAIAFLLLLFSSSALAYDESFPVDMSEMVEGLSKSGSTINGGINSTFVSRYVWRGQYYTKGPGWQPEGWVSAYGFIGSVWGSMPLANEQYQGEISEIDLSLIYAKKIKNLTVAPGYVHYLYPATPDVPSTGEAFLMLDYEFEYLHIFTSQFFDVKEYRGSYYGTFGLAFLHDFFDRFSFKGAISTSWASAEFNKVYFNVDKWTSSTVSFDTSLTIDILDWLFVVPNATYDILVDGDLRKQTGQPNLITGGITIGFVF